MERLHYLETGSTDPAYNLAFEEYVLTHRMDGDYLILWQNDNTVVVGQNQNTAAEINRAFVEAHGVHVVRRTTGGGAVYHDLGNLNYSFITDEEAGSLRLERFTAPVVDALARSDCRRRLRAATTFWSRAGRSPARPSACTRPASCTTGRCCSIPTRTWWRAR